MHELDLTKGAVLERGCVYIAEVQERLTLPRGHLGARQSQELDRPGRRLRAPADRPRRRRSTTWPRAIDGPLYLEIAPQTFSVLVRTGTRLNQLRLKAGDPPKLSTKSVGVDLTGEHRRLPRAAATPASSTWTTKTATTRATSGSR